MDQNLYETCIINILVHSDVDVKFYPISYLLFLIT